MGGLKVILVAGAILSAFIFIHDPETGIVIFVSTMMIVSVLLLIWVLCLNLKPGFREWANVFNPQL
jgi:hypothetical protein